MFSAASRTAFSKNPSRVATNTTPGPPSIPNVRRTAAGIVTRPRVENLTVIFFFEAFIGEVTGLRAL